jgi:glycosyltransferase involved in cell wall biosynthesis
MHIVSILTSLTSGGAEMLVVNLSKEYVAKGHRSTIVTLSDAESVGNSAAMEATLRQRIIDEGGSVVSLRLGRSRNVVSGWWRMRRLMTALKPDVIHAHTARALLMLFAAANDTPVVLTHHNSRLSFSVSMFKVFDRVANAYVAISKEAEAIFTRHVSRMIAYIPNAASKSFTAKRPRMAARPKPIVLSVGAISAQKHYDLLIDVAFELKRRLSADALPSFLIAGGGADLEAMRTLAQERGVAEHVSFLGERSDIAGLMEDSDLYLNTSRYEGMPVALLEAMASGLPIVATHVAGNTELVEHEKNGLLCMLDKPCEIADAILRLLTDVDLYSACSSGAVEMSDSFSIEATANSHISLFECLVSGSVCKAR